MDTLLEEIGKQIEDQSVPDRKLCDELVRKNKCEISRIETESRKKIKEYEEAIVVAETFLEEILDGRRVKDREDMVRFVSILRDGKTIVCDGMPDIVHNLFHSQTKAYDELFKKEQIKMLCNFFQNSMLRVKHQVTRRASGKKEGYKGRETCLSVSQEETADVEGVAFDDLVWWEGEKYWDELWNSRAEDFDLSDADWGDWDSSYVIGELKMSVWTYKLKK